tara:strand:+ start:311 stop:676 length:366 start_codon:yes stop_codon:yes gene_type:complete
MKLDFRTRITYTITQSSEPASLDSESFRNAKPPYTGDTEEQFWDYITDNLNRWEADDFIIDNEGLLSDSVLDMLHQTFVDSPTNVMFDSRYKSEDIIIDGGEIDETYTKYNGFNSKMNTEY